MIYSMHISNSEKILFQVKFFKSKELIIKVLVFSRQAFDSF